MTKRRFEGGHDHTLERKVDNKQKVLQLLGHRRRSTTPVIGAGRRAEAGISSSMRDAGHVLGNRLRLFVTPHRTSDNGVHRSITSLSLLRHSGDRSTPRTSTRRS
jgi:hypothetical protein